MKSPAKAILLVGVLAVRLGVSAITAPPQESGTFEVRVVDALTGKGLSGATVTLIPGSPLKTEEDGRVVFKGLATQNYAFRIERARYAPADPRSVPQYVSVGPDQKSELEIVMNPLSVVSGRVMNRNGNPLLLAGIYLMSTRYVGGRKTLVRATNTLGRLLGGETNDRGEYRLADVPPGEFYLWVDNSSLLGSKDAPDRLPRTVYYPNVLDFKSATRISVRGKDPGIDVQVPAAPVFSISGTVVNSLLGQSPTGAQRPRAVSVFYLGSGEPDVLQDPIVVESRVKGPPNEDESPFELGGFSPGKYVLYPTFGSIGGETNPTTVIIEDRDVTGLRIEMKPAADLKGRVLVEGDASTIPLQRIGLGIRPKDRIPPVMAAGALVSAPDAQTGEFTITGIMQNVRLGLLANALPSDAYVSDIRQGGNSVLSDGFIWSNPSAGLIEVRLSTRGGSVQGIVRDGSQQPAKQATVVLVPDLPRRNNSLLYKRVLTDNGGHFGLRGVAPGDYKLFAVQEAPPMGAEEDSEFLAQHENRGLSVTVASGASVEIQLPLP